MLEKPVGVVLLRTAKTVRMNGFSSRWNQQITNATAFGPFLSHSLACSVHCKFFIMIPEPNKCTGLAAFSSLHSEMRYNFLLPLIFHPLPHSLFLFFFVENYALLKYKYTDQIIWEDFPICQSRFLDFVHENCSIKSTQNNVYINIYIYSHAANSLFVFFSHFILYHISEI